MKMFAKLLQIGLVLCLGTGVLSAKELKVLMIGNSFSVCVGTYLPRIVKSVPGNQLELTSAYIGGCTLERHSDNLKKAEKDPEFKPYGIKVWSSASGKPLRQGSGNVNALLKNNKYDIITIQQGSPKSWNYATYQPFADELIAYIRKYQPKAEIVIQQTWAYRTDSPRLQPNQKASWKFDQTGMYERIRDSYAKLAKKYHFRVIPVGDAVQKYRKYTPVKYQPSETVPEYPKVPSTAGEVVGRGYWKTDAKTGKKELKYDYIHLNSKGHYLQACLWFAFLYGEPVSKIAFVPKDINEEEAKLLLRCAQEALDEYKQVK